MQSSDNLIPDIALVHWIASSPESLSFPVVNLAKMAETVEPTNSIQEFSTDLLRVYYGKCEYSGVSKKDNL
jgi:hypothetical protein